MNNSPLTNFYTLPLELPEDSRAEIRDDNELIEDCA